MLFHILHCPRRFHEHIQTFVTVNAVVSSIASHYDRSRYSADSALLNCLTLSSLLINFIVASSLRQETHRFSLEKVQCCFDVGPLLENPATSLSFLQRQFTTSAGNCWCMKRNLCSTRVKWGTLPWTGSSSPPAGQAAQTHLWDPRTSPTHKRVGFSETVHTTRDYWLDWLIR